MTSDSERRNFLGNPSGRAQIFAKERLHNLYSGKNLWNWTKPTEASRI